MKKLFAIFLSIAIVSTLCACGSVDIGPLTFHFGGGTPSGYDPDWSGNSTAADAPATDAPAVEAPAEEAFAEEPLPFEPSGEDLYDTYGSFSFNFRMVSLGRFSERGYNSDFSTEPLTPYLILAFDYEELAVLPDSHRTYVEYIELEGIGTFSQVDPDANPDHFVYNIDRYFGFNSSVNHETLSQGTADRMFACFAISEEAYAYMLAGEEFLVKVGESYIPMTADAEIYLLDELLSVYMEEGYSYEAVHAAATFLWSMDFAQYTAKILSERAEESGDPWIFDADIDHLPNLYFGGACASPATSPNLDGEFYLNVGAPGLIPELVLEVYPELDGIMWEYMGICDQMCNYALEGNLDGIYECREILREFYHVMCATVGLEPLEY
ncbi:MAG: hypothetical protein IJ017_09535 [Oscillospiraceae bacterium]|nr:hypothetical protein [Oscillospiraceae bacterium]